MICKSKKNFAARKGLWGGGLHTWSYNTPKVYITRVGKISVDLFKDIVSY